MRVRSRGARRPNCAWTLSLLIAEGAGKAGCALHPRSRVQDAQKNAHTSIQVQQRQSGLPCAMDRLDRFSVICPSGCCRTDAPTLSLRANGSRECAPDDRLREAIHTAHNGDMDCFVANAPRNDICGVHFCDCPDLGKSFCVSRTVLTQHHAGTGAGRADGTGRNVRAIRKRRVP